MVAFHSHLYQSIVASAPQWGVLGKLYYFSRNWPKHSLRAEIKSQHMYRYRGNTGCFIPNTPIKQRGASAGNSGDMGGVGPVETTAEKVRAEKLPSADGNGSFWFFWLWLQRAAGSFG
jgi:hypothetical protein